MTPKTKRLLILLLAIAFMQLLVATLFLINLNAILETVRQKYHGPPEDFTSFFGGLEYGVPVMHVVIALIFGSLAFGIGSGKKWARLAAASACLIVVIGAILFSRPPYLGIFPTALVPYVIAIIVLESLLMAIAAILALTDGGLC